LRRTLVHRHAGAVDDRAAAFEVIERGLHHVKHAEDIGAERGVELGRRDIANILCRVLLARIVDQHVDAIEAVDGGRHRMTAEVRIADIPLQQQGAAAFLRDNGSSRLGILRVVAIDDRHVGPFAREQRSNGAADATVAAGNDGDLAGEAARSGIDRLPLGLSGQGLFLAVGLAVPALALLALIGVGLLGRVLGVGFAGLAKTGVVQIVHDRGSLACDGGRDVPTGNALQTRQTAKGVSALHKLAPIRARTKGAGPFGASPWLEDRADQTAIAASSFSP
jgi:hypothetical protein